MDVEDALELLSPNFSHPAVRRYAISRLQKAPDEEILLYLLQLVQALKYENVKDIQDGRFINDFEFGTIRIKAFSCFLPLDYLRNLYYSLITIVTINSINYLPKVISIVALSTQNLFLSIILFIPDTTYFTKPFAILVKFI